MKISKKRIMCVMTFYAYNNTLLLKKKLHVVKKKLDNHILKTQLRNFVMAKLTLESFSCAHFHCFDRNLSLLVAVEKR